MNGAQDVLEFLDRGGPALWAIAVLSVVTLALILWKLWDFARMGAWARGRAERAVSDWTAGRVDAAQVALGASAALRPALARHAMACRSDPELSPEAAREEVTRVARAGLRRARAGLRPLEVIATTAPLIGLLGTVLGMIEAFQALQEAGNRADPAALAGGIWQALLTTAAGMAVAIPAAMALSWFEGITERAQADMEDLATRIFTRGPGAGGA